MAVGRLVGHSGRGILLLAVGRLVGHSGRGILPRRARRLRVPLKHRLAHALPARAHGLRRHRHVPALGEHHPNRQYRIAGQRRLVDRAALGVRPVAPLRDFGALGRQDVDLGADSCVDRDLDRALVAVPRRPVQGDRAGAFGHEASAAASAAAAASASARAHEQRRDRRRGRRSSAPIRDDNGGP